MAGILDYLTGNDASASPWGMLYNADQGADPVKAQKLAELLAAQNAASIGGMGVDPNNTGTPAASPFGDPSQLSFANPSAPAPSPGGFGAGASPFSFAGPASMPGALNVAPSAAPTPSPALAGPGLMTGINPAMVSSPGSPAPQVAQPAPAAPAPAPSPINANAAIPAGQNAPIPVGNVMMPRVGGGFPTAAADDEDEAPAAPAPGAPAAPAGVAGAPASPAPFSLAGAGNAISDRLGKATRGVFGNMALGPIGALAGGLGALISGRETDPTAIATQKMTATGQALLQKGAPLGDVQAAVNNPTLMQALINQYYGKDKYQFVKTKDAMGSEHGQAFNQSDGSVKDIPTSPGAAASQGDVFDAITRAREGGASPEQLYALAPAQLRAGAQAMIEGRALPTSLSARGDARNQTVMLAHAIDPTFDESQIGARVAGNTAFYGGGKYSEIMRKANQAPLHLGELVSDKMPALPGTPIPALNAGINFVNTNLLGKGAEGNFEVNGHAVADELATMFKGAGISDTEIRSWEKNLSPNMSVEQQRGMAKTLVGLYRDGITSLEKTRQETIGPIAAARRGPILGPEAEAALAKVEGFANGKPAASAPGASAARGTVNVGGKPISWSVN
jgi:hypothetical protein